MPTELDAKRALVARLIPIGVIFALVTTVGLYLLVPPLRGVDTPVDRLIVALRCAGVAALTLFAGIQAMAGQRGKSAAIDPIAGAGQEPRALLIHARYTQNTLEQLVLFVIVLGALATYLDADSIHLLPILTGVFIVGRVVFWLCYLRDPMYRSAGMAVAFVINGVSLVYILYRTLRLLLGL